MAVQSIRKCRGLTQVALGRLLHCTQTTISRYENGDSSPASILRLRVLLELAMEKDQLRVIFQQLQRAGAFLPHEVSIQQLQGEGNV